MCDDKTFMSHYTVVAEALAVACEVWKAVTGGRAHGRCIQPITQHVASSSFSLSIFNYFNTSSSKCTHLATSTSRTTVSGSKDLLSQALTCNAALSTHIEWWGILCPFHVEEKPSGEWIGCPQPLLTQHQGSKEESVELGKWKHLSKGFLWEMIVFDGCLLVTLLSGFL